MTYNIVDDEISWKKSYTNYVINLSTDDLVKELIFVANTVSHDLEELLDVKERLIIITNNVKGRLDMADNKLRGVVILSEAEYKQLLSETMREEMKDNIKFINDVMDSFDEDTVTSKGV